MTDESQRRKLRSNITATPTKHKRDEDPSHTEDPESETGRDSKKDLSAHNVPEKIVVVIDRAQDDVCSTFRLSSGESVSPLDMLKQAVATFVRAKQSIGRRHQFALVSLDENAPSWLHDFTLDVDSLLYELNELDSCPTEDIFDLNPLFDLVTAHVTVPDVTDDLYEPPDYVVRLVILYGRSYTLPQLDVSERIERLLSSPNFTADVLMTHEPSDENNNCERIRDAFRRIDRKGSAYVFAVARDAAEMFASTAKLVSHPSQRPTQDRAEYSLE